MLGYPDLLHKLAAFPRYFTPGAGEAKRAPRYPPSHSSYGPFKPTYIPPFHRPRTNAEAQYLYNHIRTVAWYMDALPFLADAGVPVRRGVDGLRALLALGADVAASVLAPYQIALSALFGVPPVMLVWMAVNVAIDCLLGLMHILGDILDTLFESNIRNLDLLEEWLLTDPAAAQFSIFLMPKTEFLPTCTLGVEASRKERDVKPSRTERMQKVQYDAETQG